MNVGSFLLKLGISLYCLQFLSMNILELKAFQVVPRKFSLGGRLLTSSNQLSFSFQILRSAPQPQRCYSKTKIVLRASGEVPFKLQSSGWMIPHPEKARTGGEDAYFVSPLDLGIFDGVGGWATLGIDTSLYSRKLAKLTCKNLLKQRKEGKSEVDIIQAMEVALEENNHIGSTTACVVSYDEEKNVMHGANLGDSGALVLRRDVRGDFFVLVKTKTQEHGFNFPYQLGTNCSDTPQMAERFSFVPMEGDTIILGTDGVLDNMFDQDILKCAVETLNSCKPSAIESCAKRCCEMAFNISIDRERNTPWEEGARKAGKLKKQWTGTSGIMKEFEQQRILSVYTGGKMDDITVVAARFVAPS